MIYDALYQIFLPQSMLVPFTDKPAVFDSKGPERKVVSGRTLSIKFIILAPTCLTIVTLKPLEHKHIWGFDALLSEVSRLPNNMQYVTIQIFTKASTFVFISSTTSHLSCKQTHISTALCFTTLVIATAHREQHDTLTCSWIRTSNLLITRRPALSPELQLR